MFGFFNHKLLQLQSLPFPWHCVLQHQELAVEPIQHHGQQPPSAWLLGLLGFSVIHWPSLLKALHFLGKNNNKQTKNKQTTKTNNNKKGSHGLPTHFIHLKENGATFHLLSSLMYLFLLFTLDNYLQMCKENIECYFTNFQTHEGL